MLEPRIQAHRRTLLTQFGEIGEHREQLEFVADGASTRRTDFAPHGEVVVEESRSVVRIDVVSEELTAQILLCAGGPDIRVDVVWRRGQFEFDALDGCLGCLVVVLGVGDRFETHQRRTGLDLGADRHRALLEAGAHGCAQHGLHLHALENQHGCAGLDLVADGQRSGHDECGCGRADNAALVAADAVCDAVDVDEVGWSVRVGDEAIADPVEHHLRCVLVEALDVDVRGVGVGSRFDGHAEAARADPGDANPVGSTAQFQVERATALVLHLRASARRRRQQALTLDGFFFLVAVDRGGDQRNRRVAIDDESVLGSDAVDPPGVGASVDHGGLSEEFEDEALVGGTTLDDDPSLAHGATQTAEGLVAVGAIGDDLGDHRVEISGDRVALTDSGVDADAGTGGEFES